MRTLTLVAAFSAALLLILAACGGGDDNDNNNSGQPRSSQTATEAVSTEDGAVGATDGADGDGGDAGGEGGINACDLLTAEEVEEALGSAAGDPEEGASGPSETCTWRPEQLSLSLVRVEVQEGVSEEAFRTSTETAATFLGEEAIELDGLGDAAYDLGGFIYAHKGDYQLVMTNILGFDLTNPDQERQALDVNVILMGQALQRVPE